MDQLIRGYERIGITGWIYRTEDGVWHDVDWTRRGYVQQPPIPDNEENASLLQSLKLMAETYAR